jgi:hypothetical protein
MQIFVVTLGFKQYFYVHVIKYRLSEKKKVKNGKNEQLHGLEWQL